MGASSLATSGDEWGIEVEVAEDRLFDVLENERSRRILGIVGDGPLTVGEIAERSDIPTSTLYRQLGELTEAGLVEKSIRLDPNGQHASQYACLVSEVSISIDGGLSVQVC